MVIPLILSGLLGLLIGAGIVHLAEAALGGRKLSTPYCPYCRTTYTPVQWSATAAWLSGQWRCRSCQRYLRVPRLIGELFLTVSWILLAVRYGVTPRTLLAMAALIPLAMILVTDLEAKRVPNVIILPATGVMLLLGTVLGTALPWMESGRWWYSLAGAALGFVIFRLLIWLGVAIFGEGALGEGDMTLAAYVGAAVGYPAIIEALLLAFVLGGVGALLFILSRRGSLKSAIPYGPFIILGCAVTLIWGLGILQWFLG